MKEKVTAISITLVFIILTWVFAGIRLEHFILAGFCLCLFFLSDESKKLIVGLLPFVVFAISYDWMRIYPNYLVNSIDTEGLYNLEKTLFGIPVADGSRIVPSEYFALHNNPVADFLAGVAYLGWVPVPVLFSVYLYFKGKKSIFLQFSLVFLFVNLLGFAIYYIHPAAPPWYAMAYGFEPIIGTPGCTAGLSRFDELVGFPVFSYIYGQNSNVFAAIPSLHAAYLVVALFYAIKGKCAKWVKITLATFMVGIWLTAVYTAHHYIIDVLLGILCALSGIALFQYGLLRITVYRKFLVKYYNYIQ